MQKLAFRNSGLSRKEYDLLKKLNTPSKIQDYLNRLPFDFAPGDEIDRSVRGTLKHRKADCAAGAFLAAGALWIQGRKPFLLDLTTEPEDYDHILALFQENGFWGAISKTNHAVLRYREPVYKSIRELVMSYFHEYFLPNGKKTLRTYSKPFDLSKRGYSWLADKESVIELVYLLDTSPHTKILSSEQIRNLRKADKVEIQVGEIVEYKDDI